MQEKNLQLKVLWAEEQNCRILQIKGEINYNNLSVLEQAVEGAARLPEKNIVIDMLELAYISSAGLRILLKLKKDLNQAEKNLVLFGLTEFVREVFHISGFDKIFSIYKNKLSAIESLKENEA